MGLRNYHKVGKLLHLGCRWFQKLLMFVRVFVPLVGDLQFDDPRGMQDVFNEPETTNYLLTSQLFVQPMLKGTYPN